MTLSTPKETKGFIGERYDDTSGLQYLNARYYDPRLGMFLQPDWWEVTKQGVGTNRYSYSFNDPVNGRDPSGHCNTDKDQCSGHWNEPKEKADPRQSEDAVADASIYDKKTRYVLDPSKLGADNLLSIGTAIEKYINSTNPRVKAYYEASDLKRAIERALATGRSAEFRIDGLAIKIGLSAKATTEAGRILGDIQLDLTGKITVTPDGKFEIIDGVAELNQNQRYNFELDGSNQITNMAIALAGARPNMNGANEMAVAPGGFGGFDPRYESRYSDANILTVLDRSYSFEAWGQIAW
ncbi:MAG: RHS repeat-associated core domain-containing protein [Rhodobacteraceae bacterium]|nr:RHS repeat-associated core domain-containing protein [Paracoccaceae bacterium]